MPPRPSTSIISYLPIWVFSPPCLFPVESTFSPCLSPAANHPCAGCHTHASAPQHVDNLVLADMGFFAALLVPRGIHVLALPLACCKPPLRRLPHPCLRAPARR